MYERGAQANIRFFSKYFLKKPMWIEERPQYTTMPLSNPRKMENTMYKK